MALDRHEEEARLRHGFRRVVVVAFLHVEGAVVGHLEHSDILDFRIAGLVVLRHAGMNAFAAADAAGQIEGVDKFHAVHRLVVAHVRPDPVLPLDLVLDPGQHLLHLLRAELLVIFLQELLGGAEVADLAQRREAGRHRGHAGRQGRRYPQEAAPGHPGFGRIKGHGSRS